MSDSKQHSGGQDRERINVNQEYELRDWSRKYKVSPEELKRAVAQVGDRAQDVEAHLRRSDRSRNGLFFARDRNRRFDSRTVRIQRHCRHAAHLWPSEPFWLHDSGMESRQDRPAGEVGHRRRHDP